MHSDRLSELRGHLMHLYSFITRDSAMPAWRAAMDIIDAELALADGVCRWKQTHGLFLGECGSDEWVDSLSGRICGGCGKRVEVV